MTRNRPAWTALSAMLIAPLFSGCGGGADAPTTVKLKPSESTTTDTGNGATPTTNGKTNGAAPGGVGTIRGRVVVADSLATLPPKVKAGAQIKDGEVCAVSDIPDESLMGTDGGVANVFIYLEKAPGGASVPEADSDVKIEFDNKQCRFVPHGLFVRTGQTVLITNSDPIAHNTHTNPQRNQGMNPLIGPGGAPVPIQYAQPERLPFQITCDIHNFMSAWHLALDHPYAAVTAMDGSFEIKDVPAGNHSFKVWHETNPKSYLSRGYPITVQQGENEPITIQFKSADFARVEDGTPHKRVIVSVR